MVSGWARQLNYSLTVVTSVRMSGRDTVCQQVTSSSQQRCDASCCSAPWTLVGAGGSASSIGRGLGSCWTCYTFRSGLGRFVRPDPSLTMQLSFCPVSSRLSGSNEASRPVGERGGLQEAVMFWGIAIIIAILFSLATALTGVDIGERHRLY